MYILFVCFKVVCFVAYFVYAFEYIGSVCYELHDMIFVYVIMYNMPTNGS